jgi:DNA-binding Lrp family transcriptional regulator
MDNIDQKIITQLQKDGRTSFTELAKITGFTNVGVKKRLIKLEKKGILKISALTNIQKLNLEAAFVLIEIENPDALEKLLKRFKECPRVVNIFTTLGGYNLIALVVAEDQETLKNISIEKCSLRSGEGIRRSEFIPVGNILYSPFLPIRKSLTHRDKTIAPCNVDCRTCKRFNDVCAGCPAVSGYKGIL